jgi:large subunit ribosomal protein L9
MATEVLLMTDVKGLGAEGDVVSVSDGYARTYRLPQKLASAATEAAKRRLGKMRQDREAKRKEELAGATEMVRKLEKVSCTIPVKTGDDEKMFGSVTAATIIEALKGQGIEIDKHQLMLDNPIKELGVFDVKVKLHPDVQASIKVWVVEE